MRPANRTAMLFVTASMLAACASHKEVTAPCKRPADFTSFAAEEVRAASPAEGYLQIMAGMSSDCGPLYPVNPELAPETQITAEPAAQ